MRRGDRTGIREISSSPQIAPNSGFAGSISLQFAGTIFLQPVEKFTFFRYNYLDKAESHLLLFKKRFPLKQKKEVVAL